MPTIKVEMLEGRTQEQKKEFVKLVTLAANTALGAKLEHINVVIQEYPKHHWAYCGVLFSETP